MDDVMGLYDCDKLDKTEENQKSDFKNIPLIGDIAPSFIANTTNGTIEFPKDYIGSWTIFFSHPSDFTPVCTTEFIAFQRKMDTFAKLNAKLLGLSVGALSSHLGWFDAIEKMPGGATIQFPVIDDLNMQVAKHYGMIQPHSSNTNAVRAVFIIDPNSVIRTILYYPATLGRNLDEIERILVGLQTADAFGVATPVNWVPGDDVLTPAPKTADVMRKHSGNSPWFITYKKLSKDDIYSKITKQKPGKK